MRISFKDIIDKHKGKTGYVLGMGPSLTPNIEKLAELSKDPNNIIVSCNHCESIIPEINVDYWVLANTLPSCRVQTNINKFHKRPNATLLWASSVDTSNMDVVNKLLKNNHLPYDQRNFYKGLPNIQETLQTYTGYDQHYGAGDTVALHMLSTAILLGLKDIKVIGMDLDYKKGYARNDRGVTPQGDAHKEMQKCRSRITDNFKIIYDSGKMVGANFSAFEQGSPYLNEVFTKFRS